MIDKLSIRFISIVTVAFCLSIPVWSQNERRDSIDASVITAMKRGLTGTRVIKTTEVRGQVSPLGDGSAIKFIQTLPGVATGAEGSSAIYVRGGNLGNNLITIDGVPLYGIGHMLGFSTAYSPDMVSETLFLVGGYTSEESNLTASHIKLTSKDGSLDKVGGVISASPFIMGATISTPIVRGKLSFIGSVRISPIGMEISAIKGLAHAIDSISGIRAAVYDAYGKMKWKISPRQSISLSGFSSIDSYGYNYGITSKERISWNNRVATLSHEWNLGERWSLHSGASYNSFNNYQGMYKLLGETSNDMALASGVEEWTFQSMAVMREKKGWTFQGGFKGRMGGFTPGTTSDYSDALIVGGRDAITSELIKSTLLTAHAQLGKSKEEWFDLRASGRVNHFRSSDQKDSFRDAARTDLEGSFLARVFLPGGLGLEATVDRTVQYYHTLEGIPLGWSLDMIIPSDVNFVPETATQYYAGAFLVKGCHRFTAGGYFKTMDHLLFFADASQLFSSVTTAWKDNVKQGSGTSKGIEILYETDLDKFNARVTYTLSKTDRQFEDINEGRRFPAKFDRRHILNVSMEYLLSNNKKNEFGLNTFFTYQSGHWATVPAGQFSGWLIPDGEEIVIDYHTIIHNWQMPAYIRWDIGGFLRYGIGTRYPGTLNFGIYNLLNRHNPYSITYDANDRRWKQLSIFPIMPTVSWTMEF